LPSTCLGVADHPLWAGGLFCATTAHVAAIDLFVVPTIGCKLRYRPPILRLARRRLVWTDVTANPTAEWVARQVTEAFPLDEVPHYLMQTVTRRIWRGGHAPAPNDEYSRLADCAAVAVAKERSCRTADRIDPTRVSRPRRYDGARTHLVLNKDTLLHRQSDVSHLGSLQSQYLRLA
jgi:hypothetical protein